MTIRGDNVQRSIIDELQNRQLQLVLAESCTAGMVSSKLAGIPGASSVLAGSWVVYQVEAKQQWLDIPRSHFESFDVVSRETSQVMAESVLKKTPWADVAASITGHLGPNAPADLDGIAYATIATRANELVQPESHRFELGLSNANDPVSCRLVRQNQAAELLMQLILDVLQSEETSG